MKKTLLFVTLALLVSFTMLAQETFVSTQAANKNVLLEEFTGKDCGYCPDGHRIANELMTANPDRVAVINIHTGGYASGTPNYQTTFGAAIANQTGLDGYPSGTVNRHVFSGSVTALGRGNWGSAANTIMAASSYVNVACRSTIDAETRELTCHVQAYFTGSGAPATMKMNVALLQNNIIGPQSGSSLNPSQVVGSQYRHMHMLRHLLTGQWGADVTTTTQGTLYDETFTYVIPDDLNSIPYVLPDLTVVVFIAEGQQEVITACHSEMEFLNVPETGYELVDAQFGNSATCGVDGEVTIKNLGSTPITTAELTYSVDGATPVPFTFTGNLDYYESGVCTLSDIALPDNQAASIVINLISVNGVEVANPTDYVLTQSYTKNVANSTLTLTLRTDSYGSETTWKLYGPTNNVIATGGPYTDAQTTQTVTIPANGTAGCYHFTILDSYGDGMTYGNAYYYIKDNTGRKVVDEDGSFAREKTSYFYWDGIVGVEDYEMNAISIYPNPATDNLTINSQEAIQNIAIMNLQGQKVFEQEGNVNLISVSNLSNGLYILKVTTSAGISNFKFVKE